MKKSSANFKKMMITGMASGILVSSVHAANDTSSSNNRKSLMELAKEKDGNITASDMTEDELLLQLNDEGIRIYKSLSPAGKQLALEMAGRACNGTNSCKGLNACKTDKNACYGQGSCKGTTVCGFSDKNLAVKLASKQMAQKRLEAEKK